MKTAFLVFVAAACAVGQQIDLSSLDHLASKARETANVSLDANKLRIASQFLSGDKAQDQKAKELMASIKGVFVRAFEFDGPGAYSQADLDPIRKQLRAPGWDKVIEVKDRDESAEIYFFSQNNQYGGFAVMASEPRELVVVNIVGPIDINALASLSGSFGIPSINTNLLGGKKRTTGSDKNEKDDE